MEVAWASWSLRGLLAPVFVHKESSSGNDPLLGGRWGVFGKKRFPRWAPALGLSSLLVLHSEATLPDLSLPTTLGHRQVPRTSTSDFGGRYSRARKWKPQCKSVGIAFIERKQKIRAGLGRGGWLETTTKPHLEPTEIIWEKAKNGAQMKDSVQI